jgi:hypothetical protein
MSTGTVDASGTRRDVPVMPDVRVTYIVRKQKKGSTYTVRAR